MQLQELDTEIVVATTTGTATNATAVAANIVVDERQMNALFLDVVSYFRLNQLEPKDNLYVNIKKFKISLLASGIWILCCANGFLCDALQVRVSES